MQTSPFELFRRLTNGVYVVTASHEGTPGAFTAAWITQVSFEPVLIAISINPQNATWPLIDASGRFVTDGPLACVRPGPWQFSHWTS
jgi:flavin reductase (DIM6/NTAB) family NADH-FMN oxidoreductase RutF